MRSGVITLMTDFGLSDTYAGVMKGVICRINPAARVIDLTHDIAPFNILQAAVQVADSYEYFPTGTVHVIVIDPGVGSGRKILCMKMNGHFFLAPDNGVLSAVYDPDGIEAMVQVTNRHLFLPEVSSTFHGRDIFAPVAARLAAGLVLEELGEATNKMVHIEIPVAEALPDGTMKGTILWVDHFGNLITNIRTADLQDRFVGRDPVLSVSGRTIRGISSNFASASQGELLAVRGSFGRIEISVREGSAAHMLSAGPGTTIILH